jgi:DNA replication protein DnaC
MDRLVTERIEHNLDRLGLIGMKKVYVELTKEAHKKSLSYTQYLDMLLEEEVASKQTHRYQLLLREAAFPYSKTLEGFDFSYQPNLDKRKIQELFTLDFALKKENVIFLGPPGVGKTHLAIALGMKACQKGIRTYFLSMDMLMKKMQQERNQRFPHLRRYYQSPIVIIDELGYLPLNQQESNLFFQFVSYHYERHSLIITSNKGFRDWGEIFGDKVIASAILDRLLHHSHVINIKGSSYRLKDKLKQLTEYKQTQKPEDVSRLSYSIGEDDLHPLKPKKLRGRPRKVEV